MTCPDQTACIGTRFGPFYKFLDRRLSIPAASSGLHYLAFEDAYGNRKDNKPRYYAFFQFIQRGWRLQQFSPAAGAIATTWTDAQSDCNSLGLWPYQTASPPTANAKLTYANPAAWQIICAGNDGIFGSGTNPSSEYYWNATTAAMIPAGGADDRTNFATGKLQFWP